MKKPKTPLMMTELKKQTLPFKIAIAKENLLNLAKFSEVNKTKEYIIFNEEVFRLKLKVSKDEYKPTYKIARTEVKMITFLDEKKKLVIYHDDYEKVKFIEIKDFKEKFGHKFSEFEENNKEKKEDVNNLQEIKNNLSVDYCEKKENPKSRINFQKENLESVVNNKIYFEEEKKDFIRKNDAMEIVVNDKIEIIFSKEEEIKKMNDYVAEELLPQITKYKYELKELSLKNSQLSNQNDELKRGFEEIRNKKEINEKEIEHLICEQNNYKKASEQHKQELFKEISILKEEKIEILDKQNNIKKEKDYQMEESEKIIKTLKERITQLILNNEKLESEFTIIKQEFSQIEKLKGENDYLKADIRDKNLKSKEKDNEILKCNKSIQDQNKIIDENKQLISQLNNEIKSKNNEIYELKIHKSNEKTYIHQLSECEINLKNQVSIVQILESENVQIKKDFELKQSENERIKKENENLSQILISKNDIHEIACDTFEKQKAEFLEKIKAFQIGKIQYLDDKNAFEKIKTETVQDRLLIEKERKELIQEKKIIESQKFELMEHNKKIEVINLNVLEQKEHEIKIENLNREISKLLVSKENLEKIFQEMETEIANKNFHIQELLREKNKQSSEKEKIINEMQRNIDDVLIKINYFEEEKKTQKINNNKINIDHKNMYSEFDEEKKHPMENKINENVSAPEYHEKEKKSKNSKKKKIKFDFVENAIQNFLELDQIKKQSTVDDELEKEILKVLKQKNKTIKIITKKLEENNLN